MYFMLNTLRIEIFYFFLIVNGSLLLIMFIILFPNFFLVSQFVLDLFHSRDKRHGETAWTVLQELEKIILLYKILTVVENVSCL